MRKSSSSQRSLKQVAKAGHTRSMTIGVDLGDKNSCYCVLDSNGVIVEESRVGTTKASISKVIIAHPRQVKLISASSRKDDRLDAQTLARLARVDPNLLRPIQHRSRKAQGDLMVVRVRAALVEARSG